MKKMRTLIGVLGVTLLASAAVVASGQSAAAQDECALTGYMTAAGDYASLYEPNGPCYLAVLQGGYYETGYPAQLYYDNIRWARLRYPDWSTPGWIGPASMYTRLPPPSNWEVHKYRGCRDDDIGALSCSISSWIFTFGNQGLP